jgi:FkbM family methyltransferase
MSLPRAYVIGDGKIQYIVFDKPDIVTNGVRTGGYEPELQEFSKHLLDGKSPGFILDIGANIGSYTIPLAKKFPQHTYLCFEPQRVIYYQLCGNIVLNSLANTAAYPIALSDEPKVITLDMPDYLKETNVGAFSLDPEVRMNQYECHTVGQKERVEMVTLDSLGIPDIRLIKVDVEGMELAVLQGAEETLTNNNFPPVIFEAWTWKSWYRERRIKLLDYMHSLGYKIHTYGENNVAQHANYGPIRKWTY